ncbi:hypothetical protein NQK81_21645 [Amycolatopsis roodepoortensis]|uniref:hypothetical protein n=1 Tax=Amycolatopsis roodepoortensis TaxID=700274 RepID=UPI00214B7C85|nr:hypothetical protein [Amycolatopsis roodepoortensis]UUV35929.1 hypothetical protein NQK81_21645 [Amycolatopsis roodepoortensis]
MTRTAHQTTAVRGQLARFVAVLAVLAGVAFAVGLQCTEGMVMPMAHGMGQAETHIACDSAASHEGSSAEMRVAAPCAAESGGMLDHQGLGGTLATCLAFLFAVFAVFAVFAAVAALPPSRLRGLVTAFRRVRTVVVPAVWSRAPRLEELCLLRA